MARPMKAWVVTWDWAGDAGALADKLAAILPPRLRHSEVAKYVERLYALRTSTAAELASYARNRSNNPYRAHVDINQRITCGHHPFLFARKVSNLVVKTNRRTNLETISWLEPDIYEMRNNRPAKVSDGVQTSIQRRIDGPLSVMPIWDRTKRRFKKGWGPNETPTRSDC